MDFIVNNLPMLLCFLLGIGMLVMQAFLPGFGLPGLSGIALEITAVVLCWLNVGSGAALCLLLFILLLITAAISISLRSAAKGRLSHSSIINNDTESSENGYSAQNDMSAFNGLTGETLTVLRPTGMAMINGMKLNVMTSGEFIQQGTRIHVIRTDGGKIIVQAE